MKPLEFLKLPPPKSAGQALVEFAFVLPVLLLMMVAIVDFGIIFYAQMTVTNAAWEAARAGATIVDPTRGDQEIIGAVQAAAYGLDNSRLMIDIVTVQYQVELSFPSLTVPITGKAVTRMEYQNP